ncbi:hypothetical protein [Salinisphaera orenii]|uniref:hypothetical protein n=1 Tax=Salinisphaera orenii TaxID=856731 RepID=UPI0019550FC3
MKRPGKEIKSAYKEHKRSFTFTAEALRIAPTARKRRQAKHNIESNHFPGTNSLCIHIPKMPGTSLDAGILSEIEDDSDPSWTDRALSSPHKHAKAWKW